jgi:adenine-specific DNA-methyltransferase
MNRKYAADNAVTLATADCLKFLKTLPSDSVQLAVTSPPYNIGKEYEQKQTPLADYVRSQRKVIDELVRVVRNGGSICYQVGHYTNGQSQVVPLDMLLYPCFRRHERRSRLRLRNRIIWHFEFGKHATHRFSGRHECVLWFTKGDDFTFNLDPLRVPQKYPGKKGYRGTNKGKPSGNPKGKNPGDVWRIPNVKGMHIEKTSHPCQFPVELAQNLVLATTHEGDLVLDPYVGSGTAVAAAVLLGRRAAGCDIRADYVRLARKRVKLAHAGQLQYRPRGRKIYQPPPGTALTTVPDNFCYAGRDPGDRPA